MSDNSVTFAKDMIVFSPNGEQGSTTTETGLSIDDLPDDLWEVFMIRPDLMSITLTNTKTSVMYRRES